jgi:hypothetical protein
MFKPLTLLAALLTAPVASSAAESHSTGATPQLRAAITAMKANARGPFARIRWFCKDGRLLPPTPSACEPYGGGHQHGEWTDAVKTLRADGYLIANVLADLDVEAFAAQPGAATALGQILIEQYLIRTDDGWILRKARYYRGAFQEEGERAGARRLLLALAAKREFIEHHYLVLRTAAGLLPHGREDADARAVRQRAADLATRDPGFSNLRNKIHLQPEFADIAKVRAYAAQMTDPELAAALEDLARMMSEVYAPRAAAHALESLRKKLGAEPALSQLLASAAAEIEAAGDARARVVSTARQLARLREAWAGSLSAVARIALLDASNALESDYYVAANELGNAPGVPARRESLALLVAAADASYGAGLISARQRSALNEAIGGLGADPVPLARYRDVIDYLALAPAWGTQQLRLQFGTAIDKYLELEPRTAVFIQDQLRGSPLFAYSARVEPLTRDARHLAGVRSELFGADVGAGLRSLNPGFARGRLHLATDAHTEFHADGIYVLPETASDLPPVAGILTAGEGNPLSHVQLLARNLGIPNVAVDIGLLERIREYSGRAVVLAVSPGGSVRLTLDDGSLESVFAQAAAEPEFVIRPDLAKLDLEQRGLIPLERLRATDSGRVVGPKAAKLGELKARYPEAVADGIAIPFGVFRALLDRPRAGEARTVFAWITDEYRRLAGLPAASAERRAQTEAFRSELETWVTGVSLDPAFAAELRSALETRFGPDGRYGVFVRSDTNVEDLPGFTGAGLNLTLANVVGIDNILKAIPRVWASPFTARSFAWRQAHMEQPEHVYPAILLLQTVPAEKSGVLVTRDVDTGDDRRISVAVNEGVGGAVDGQAAESLRIDKASGAVRVLAQATAPLRRVPDPEGGVAELPVSGGDAVLLPEEIAQLVVFVNELPSRFPPIVDERGEPAAADVEFGFVGGQLRLFQVRPFNESRRARGSRYLAGLDPDPAAHANVTVDLSAAPSGRATADR